MSKNILITIVIAALVIAGAVIMFNKKKDTPGTIHTYVSEQYGLAFSYPDRYFLEEREVDNEGEERFSIVLMEDTEENRRLGDPDLPPREGPPTMNVDIFENDSNLAAESFIRQSPFSNFQLGPQELTPVTLSGLNGFRYRWSGLYEGESHVVATDERVYMFSVSFLTSEDQIITDFNGLLSTVTIE